MTLIKMQTIITSSVITNEQICKKHCLKLLLLINKYIVNTKSSKLQYSGSSSMTQDLGPGALGADSKFQTHIQGGTSKH